ncbi:hypothetical protein D7Z26_09175 [Cohnella endophytica]|uniref:Helicase XPB/Ssl2 N-terminal domain-containing protein n=1 Tax=Cohnella endophytica TaxID=2419778 RepID=A0A494XXQ8_9BACL|nr:helicase-associated domain-containing protein [Cohnella endophytica]RKP55357.1 hypothetical protein D7Z26_09175 [Cohnella endophytica]
MNVAQSLLRLPESIRALIETDPVVRERLEDGQYLEDILRCREWAEAWLRSYLDTDQRAVLNNLVERFASKPFEPVNLIKSLGRSSAFAGSEVRVALAKLRRSGIIFAVRKAWGDQLLYLPEDTVTLWQPLLLPLGGEPLAPDEAADVTVTSSALPLPLSMELLSAWQTLRRQPLTWTGKGSLHRPTVAKFTGELRFPADAIRCLNLTYPHADQLAPQAAIALDIGLHLKALMRSDNEIKVAPSGMENWLALSPAEADARLYDILLTRYGKADAGLQLIASAVRALEPGVWFRESRLVIDDGNRNGERFGLEWLGLMEAFGWLERGDCAGEAVYRKRLDNEPKLSQSGEAGAIDAFEELFVQPDGELFVPPDAKLKLRWMLADIADPVTSDAICIYRLSRNACARAYNAGYVLRSVTELLEQASRAPLPEPVADSLADWFAPLGKIKFAEAMLLRTEDATVADAIMRDPDIADMLLEKIGDRDFIVLSESYSVLSAKLRQIGYPPPDRIQVISSPASDKNENHPEETKSDSGWVYAPDAVGVYEADPVWPDAESLFPGLSEIPAAWIMKPRAYHATTRKKMIQRAIEWEALVRLEVDGSARTFVPNGLREDGDRWTVSGRWQSDDCEIGTRLDKSEQAFVNAEQFTDMMIVLPSLDALETD